MIASATWLMTVLLSVGMGLSFQARKLMPRNMTPSSTPSHASTRRAFFHSTGLNAGTPLEIASTPVIAVEPPANACSNRKIVRPPPAVPAACSDAVEWIGLRSPVTARASPMPTSPITDTTKR